MAMAFAISLSAMPEDLKTVMSFYRPEMDKGFIFISKVDMTLTLVGSQGQVVATYPIACGENIGQKSIKGDHKTPEGYFLLQNIHESSKWGHDFHDGKGFIRNAYGPYFLRLQTGFQGIGIHGTHAPESIGTRATEGCIRLENKNIADLETRVSIGMPVIIGPEAGVASLIASNAPSPVHPRLWRGKTNTTVTAPKVQEPERTVTPIASAAPLTADHVDIADPVVVPQVAPLIVDHLLTVVDGQLDINPETDLTDPALADITEPAQPAPAQPAPVPAVSPADGPEPASVAQPDQPAVNKHRRHRGPTYIKPDTTTVATPQTTPQYEVVVVEVTQPDGTVKYEVQYKPIK